MMKKLLLGLLALAYVGAVNAQLIADRQVNNVKLPAKKTSVLSGAYAVSGDKVVKKAGKTFNFKSSNHQWIGANALQMPAANLAKAGSAIAKAPNSSVQDADVNTRTWYGYSGESVSGVGFGNFSSDVLKDQNVYNVAISIPGTYEKAVIDSIVVPVLGGCTYDDLKVWVAPSTIVKEGDQQYYKMPQQPEDAPVCYSVPAADVNEVLGGLSSNYFGYVVVKLPKTYTITNEGCFVGYAYTGKNSDTSVLFFSDSNVSGGWLMSYDYNGERVFEDLSELGNLLTMVGMDLSDCEANNADVNADPEITTLVNTANRYNFYITNNSAKPITSITYQLSVDGEENGFRDMTLNSPIEAGSTATIPASVTFADEGMHSIDLVVSKVNGNDNVSEYTEATNSVIALEKAAERVSVVEELTGTWCGWCPRGHVGLANLNKDLGDKVVTIAAHISQSTSAVDPMNIYNLTSNATQAEAYADYGWVALAMDNMLGGSGFPGALYDRLIDADPYSGANTQLNANNTVDYGATDLAKAIKEGIPSEADFSMTASWTDESKSSLSVDVTTTFNYDRFASAPYGLAFILTENGMTGAAKDGWRQTNYYAKLLNAQGAAYYNNADMAKWFSAGQYVSTSYDNVAVQAWSPLGTTYLYDNPETDDIIKGEAKKFSTVLGVNSSLIQDKDQLSLNALLINLNSFAVVNAAKVYLSPAAAGIEDVDAEASNTVVSRFNLNGMGISAPQKGINLVKTADGKVVKVAVGK